MEKEEFTDEYLFEELALAARYFDLIEFEEMKPLMEENATMNDVKRAAAFYKIIRYSYGTK